MQKGMAEYDADVASKKRALEQKLASLPPATIHARVSWDQHRRVNGDDFGQGVFAVAEPWMRLMEARLKNGGKLTRRIADETFKEANANWDILSGSQAPVVWGLVIQCWSRGEELRAFLPEMFKSR